MTIFERILRVFSGHPRKCLLGAFFDDQKNAKVAIILEETGFPYGGVSTYYWWTANSSGYFGESHRCFGRTGADVSNAAVAQDSEDRFCRLYALLEEYRDLANYSRKIRDGVVYRIAWGTIDNKHMLAICNPSADTKHFALITLLKQSVWS